MPIISSNISTTSTDGYDITNFNVHLTVAEGVTIVTEEANSGISMGDDGFNWVQNNGSIDAGDGIYSSGDQSYIWNSASGEIFGYNGIASSGGDSYIENDGNIVATSWGETIDGDDNYVINRGDISSQGSGLEISTSGNAGTFENFGTISGGQNSIYDFDGAGLTIDNYGTLDGNVALTNTATTFLNRGDVIGNISFGGGANVFNGVKGEVTGTISGGSGDDIFNLGADGETVDGGAGKNKVYAGAGADTFIYSAMGAGDLTNIFGFNASMDTIQLDSSVFTKLTAGATPKFHIGTSASGATDFLFYNNVNGALYYDADGSGKGAAVELGLIGAGLKLTADNFNVV